MHGSAYAVKQTVICPLDNISGFCSVFLAAGVIVHMFVVCIYI